MTKTNYTSLDVEGHNGSTAGLYLGGTLVTATAAEISKVADYEYQAVTAAGAITIKNGFVLLGGGAGAIAATLADPVAGTDDFKRLTIANLNTDQNTIVSDGQFGNAAADHKTGTFSAAVGNTLNLMAYGGFWYIVGNQNCTVT